MEILGPYGVQVQVVNCRIHTFLPSKPFSFGPHLWVINSQICFGVSWLTILGSQFELWRRWYVIYALMILSIAHIKFITNLRLALGQHTCTHRMCPPRVPLVMLARIISAACRAAESDVSSSGKSSRDSDNKVSM